MADKPASNFLVETVKTFGPAVVGVIASVSLSQARGDVRVETNALSISKLWEHSRTADRDVSDLKILAARLTEARDDEIRQRVEDQTWRREVDGKLDTLLSRDRR